MTHGGKRALKSSKSQLWECKKGSGQLVRTPILVIGIVGLALCAALTVVGTAMIIHRLKDMLVTETQREAMDSTRAASEKVEAIARDLLGADGFRRLAQHPEVIGSLRHLSGEGGIVVAEIRDNQGRVLLREVDSRFATRDGQGAAPRTDSLIPVVVPIWRDGQQIGVFQVGISRQLALGRIELLDSQISNSLRTMVLVVSAILLLTLALAWIAYQRQVELAARTQESEHLADMGALASGLAHEVRNPLHAMTLHLAVAREDLDDFVRAGNEQAAGTAECIDRVQRQVDRLGGIVTHFLNLSLPCRVNLEPMRLDLVVREAATFLSPDLEARGVKLEIDLPDEVTVKGDYNAIYQVLLNVMLNAGKAMGSSAEKRIRIRVLRDRKAIRLHVEDSGPGIPESEREVIFRAFVSKQCGGTGVGLSLAWKVMAKHDGAIRAGASRELGGALIELEFPASAAASAA
jgi:signal transduction histidine kinase